MEVPGCFVPLLFIGGVFTTILIVSGVKQAIQNRRGRQALTCVLVAAAAYLVVSNIKIADCHPKTASTSMSTLIACACSR
jgi:hypothetical protein